MNLFLCVRNFKYQKTEIKKKNNPYKWLSGQIAKDLIVGDNNNSNEININIFLL